MKVFNQQPDGEIQGRYKCDLCSEIILLRDEKYFQGYIVTDMDDLSHKHICRECYNEIFKGKIDKSDKEIWREILYGSSYYINNGTPE